jgi:hypothetical protein
MNQVQERSTSENTSLAAPKLTAAQVERDCIGGGPPFRKAGRYALYHPDDLDGWIAGKLSDPVMSTSALSKIWKSDGRHQ